MLPRLAVACALTMLCGSRMETSRERVLFTDEFSGSTLDRSKWNVIVTGRTVNNEQQAYVDATDVLDVRNGTLVIHPRFREAFQTPEGRVFDFISGRLDTRSKFSFTYGTTAARMKLASGAGLWPAFWALGEGRWPDTGEIDVMENVGDPSWTSAALHGPKYFGDTPLVKRYTLPKKDVTAWHVYSVDWTPASLAFKVDGVTFYTVTKAMVEQYGPWAFDNPKFLILNLALGGNYPEGVRKTDSTYRGLPQATIDAIKRDQVEILVDWVRVTAPR